MAGDKSPTVGVYLFHRRGGKAVRAHQEKGETCAVFVFVFVFCFFLPVFFFTGGGFFGGVYYCMYQPVKRSKPASF